MLNFKTKELRNILFFKTYKYFKINDLRNELFNNFEMFSKQDG